jgi:hypothetical protein
MGVEEVGSGVKMSELHYSFSVGLTRHLDVSFWPVEGLGGGEQSPIAPSVIYHILQDVQDQYVNHILHRAEPMEELAVPWQA